MSDWAPLDGLGRRLHRRHRHALVRADIKSKRRLDEAQETIGLWAEATRDADRFSSSTAGSRCWSPCRKHPERPRAPVRIVATPPTKSAILRKCGWAPVHV